MKEQQHQDYIYGASDLDKGESHFWLQNLVFCVLEFMEGGDLFSALRTAQNSQDSQAQGQDDRQMGWYGR